MKKYLVFLLIGLMLISCNTLFAKGKVVICEGAGDNSPRGRDIAIQDALRRAVEQGVGVHVDSNTMTKNYMMIKDEIYTKAKGFVTNYKVIWEGNKNGMFMVKIKATVNTMAIKNKLQALGILYEQLGKPRIVVLLRRVPTVPGQKRTGTAGQAYAYMAISKIEQAFLDREFDVVKYSEVKRLNERSAKGHFNAAAASGDDVDMANSQAASIADRLGADLAVMVTLSLSSPRSRTGFGGRKMHMAVADIDCEVLNKSDGRVIVRHNTQVKASTVSSFDLGIRKAIKKAGNWVVRGNKDKWKGRLEKGLEDKILKKWGKVVNQGGTISIDIARCDWGSLRYVKKVLKNCRNVVKITQRSFSRGTALLELQYKGQASDLADSIMQQDEKKNRIRITTIEGSKIGLEAQ